MEDLAIEGGLKTSVPGYTLWADRSGHLLRPAFSPIHPASGSQGNRSLVGSFRGRECFYPLHTFNAGFRAVENGFTLVRVTGDGYSAVIDPYYRLWSAQDTFEQGTDNFTYNVR